MAQVDIVIKSGAKSFPVSADGGANVSALKAQLEEVAQIPAGQQRLIYSGRILKDEQTLESYGIKSEHTIHLVKSAKPSAAGAGSGAAGAGTAAGAAGAGAAGTGASGTPAPPLAAGQGSGNVLSDLTGARYAGLASLPSASMFGPDGGMGPMPDTEQMLGLLEVPEYAEAMQQIMQDPEVFLSTMGSSIPPEQAEQMRQMLRSPEFRQLLSNPQALRQAMQLSQQFRGLMGDGAGAGAGGFPAPGNPDDTLSRGAGAGAAQGAGAGGAQSAATNPLLAGLGGLGGFGGLGALGAGANPFAFQPPQPQDTRPPEERYESQLQQLNELGFYDFDRNVSALRRSGGNVQGAIEAMLDGHV